MNKPEGFTTITPYMFVDNAEAFVTFLKTAFDANELSRTLQGQRIANVLLQINDSMLFVSEATESYPAMASAYYIYVENVNTGMQKALAAGGQLEMDIMDMPYGDRQGGIRDNWGNIWWISQRMINESYQ